MVFGPNGSGPGSTNSHDTTQPKAYPTTGRGQLYSALTAMQQGQVRSYIEAWINYLHPSIASKLLAIYESPQALAEKPLARAARVLGCVGTTEGAGFPSGLPFWGVSWPF